MDIELRHFRCFLAIAGEQNITKAAASLHMTQPALSRTLRQLEDIVGARLVDRSTRHLELTAEGEAFRGRAERVMSALHDALTLRNRPLRVGHSWSAIGEYTSDILNTFEGDVELKRIDERDAGVLRGVTDVAIVRGDIDEDELHVERLYDEPRVAAVHVDNPLATRATLTLDQLVEFPVVNNIVSGTTTPELWTGIKPSIVGVSNTDDWLMVIAANRAVGVTPRSTSVMYPHTDIVYIGLSDAPEVPVSLAWRQDSTHPAIRSFVATAKKIVNR